MLNVLGKNEDKVVNIDHKTMGKDQYFGFISFDWMQTFFKGIHFTLKSWDGN